MHIGWNFFEYTKPRLEENKSFCNTDIVKYSQTIFYDEPQPTINLISSASRSLDIIIKGCSIEITLTVWNQSNTEFILLNKIEIKAADFQFKECLAKSSNFNIELKFYASNDIKEFRTLYNYVKCGKKYEIIEKAVHEPERYSDKIVKKANINPLVDRFIELDYMGCKPNNDSITAKIAEMSKKDSTLESLSPEIRDRKHLTDEKFINKNNVINQCRATVNYDLQNVDNINISRNLTLKDYKSSNFISNSNLKNISKYKMVAKDKRCMNENTILYHNPKDKMGTTKFTNKAVISTESRDLQNCLKYNKEYTNSEESRKVKGSLDIVEIAKENIFNSHSYIQDKKSNILDESRDSPIDNVSLDHSIHQKNCKNFPINSNHIMKQNRETDKRIKSSDFRDTSKLLDLYDNSNLSEKANCSVNAGYLPYTDVFLIENLKSSLDHQIQKPNADRLTGNSVDYTEIKNRTTGSRLMQKFINDFRSYEIKSQCQLSFYAINSVQKFLLFIDKKLVRLVLHSSETINNFYNCKISQKDQKLKFIC